MSEAVLRTLYLDLMKKSILGFIVEDKSLASFPSLNLTEANLTTQDFNRKLREHGQDWPSQAQSMIGLKRMDNIQKCVEQVISDRVPGDLIETGVWRGGATIFMQAILKAYGIRDRNVWVADSFEGLPAPNIKKYPADTGLDLSNIQVLAVTIEEVRSNFERYGLLDEQVRFLKGWFRDTLPTAPIEQLAVLRLDGDLYESTMDSISNLYPKLSVGGYVIIDDYQIPACAKAIHDYREQNNITEKILVIDETGVFWRREQN
ncbi:MULTISPECIES: TylF/MycF family methyltransferase [unclassified Moorena]|uniref:TylF/MycF family methyltransferase n=1 Tax=unclassified Moorena TaxID=2683338 RepID=UPI0014006F10|nr:MULTISPECIES: TylF/MycF family methyltransferase [unclassified Moorena]NEO12986.1 macrocin O-methyltransferase [Moorena sp. SIO3E8]NEQ02890.1 macrocin O-methyltransferase [Moorena sp. SIO3F7]